MVAVAAAGFISVMQADDQRRRDLEQRRTRALDAAEDRIQVLLTAIKVCLWSRDRLVKTAEYLGTHVPIDSRAALPLVAPELGAFADRLASLSLHGQHMTLRENIIAAEGMLAMTQSGIALAIADLDRKGMVNCEPVTAQLAANLRLTSANLDEIANSLGNGAAALRVQAAALDAGRAV